jgi:hypothetical protein
MPYFLLFSCHVINSNKCSGYYCDLIFSLYDTLHVLRVLCANKKVLRGCNVGIFNTCKILHDC